MWVDNRHGVMVDEVQREDWGQGEKIKLFPDRVCGETPKKGPTQNHFRDRIRNV